VRMAGGLSQPPRKILKKIRHVCGDVQNGRSLALLKNDSPVSAAKFSPDGKRIVTHLGMMVRPACGMHGADNPCQNRWYTAERYGRYNSSPDGKRFLTTSGDHTLRVWDVQGAEVVLHLLKQNTSGQFSSDGKRIVTVTDAGSGQARSEVWTRRVASRLQKSFSSRRLRRRVLGWAGDSCRFPEP